MSSTSHLMDEPAQAEMESVPAENSLQEKAKQAAGSVESLTPRQREVLALIGQGLSTAEIARRLYRTVKTIESHRLMLGKRLGARNRVELARIAIQAGLTDLTAGPSEGPAGADEASEASARGRTRRALAMIDEGSQGRNAQGFLQALVNGLLVAFDAQGAYVMRVGADGNSRSVAGASETGPTGDLKYSFAGAEDAELVGGEVREIDGPPATMLASADPALYLSIGASLLTALTDSRGQRLGTLALFLKSKPDDSQCIREVLRLLAGRAAAELERKESEDRFNHLQALVSSAAERMGLWERDLRSNRVIWSAETYRILGLEPHQGAPTREQFFALIHPDDRERVRTASEDLIRRSAASVIEYRVIRPDGATRNILACYETAPDITGRAGWVFGTIKDVTSD